MIGIDANVLLRLWLNDEPTQNRRLDVLLAEYGNTPASVLVTDVVLVEAIWTLRSSYEQNKAAQVLAVRSLLEEAAFAFEDRDAVTRALTMFELSACGFSDCLIAAKHALQGCDFTATFDRRMQRLPGVRVI